MKNHCLRFALAAITVTAALGASSVAQVNVWTDTFGSTAGGGPYWLNFAGFEGNWSLGRVPLATDAVLFTVPVAAPNSFFQTGALPYQPLASGATVLLAPGAVAPPPLVAYSLTFMGNFTLVTAAATFNDFPALSPAFIPYPVEALTLTSGQVMVGRGFTATVDVPLASGTGSIIKTGPGTLILNQPLLNSAALPPIYALNPNMQAFLPPQPGLNFVPAVQGNLIIQQGTVGGNFAVSGNLMDQKGGALSMLIAAPNVYERKAIWGTASLKGNLDVSLAGGFQPKKGEKFTLLNASDVSGEFKNVNAPVFGLLTLRPFYSHDSVILKAVVNSFAVLPGMSANQVAVGQNLDAVINDPRETKLLNFLYGRTLSDLPKQLDKLAPSGMTSVFASGVAMGGAQAQTVQARADGIRSGLGGFSAAGLAINGDNPSYSGGFDITSGVAGPNGSTFGVGNDGKEVKETKEVAPAENRWGAFLSGTGEWVSVGDTNNARGYTLDSGGFTLGVDYKICPNCAIGIAAGYTGTTSDLFDNGRVWINGGKLGLYATTFAGGWYADVAVFGGYNSYDTRRNSIQGQARGDTDGGELDALFSTGYDFKAGNFTIGPTGSFNYTYLGVNGFDEHGSLAPMSIHGNDEESLRTAFGFKATYDLKVGGVTIRPELRAAWQHEFGDTAYAVDSSLASGAGNTFTVSGPRIGRDSALLGAGFAVECSDRCSTYIYYDGELGRKNYQSTAVTGGIRVKF